MQSRNIRSSRLPFCEVKDELEGLAEGNGCEGETVRNLSAQGSLVRRSSETTSKEKAKERILKNVANRSRSRGSPIIKEDTQTPGRGDCKEEEKENPMAVRVREQRTSQKINSDPEAGT